MWTYGTRVTSTQAFYHKPYIYIYIYIYIYFGGREDNGFVHFWDKWSQHTNWNLHPLHSYSGWPYFWALNFLFFCLVLVNDLQNGVLKNSQWLLISGVLWKPVSTSDVHLKWRIIPTYMTLHKVWNTKVLFVINLYWLIDSFAHPKENNLSNGLEDNK